MHMNPRRNSPSEKMAKALIKEGIKFKRHYKTTDENGKSIWFDFAVLDNENNVVETFNLEKQKFHTQLEEKDVEKLKAFTEKEIAEKDAIVKTKNGEFFSKVKMNNLKKFQEKGKEVLAERERKNSLKEAAELKVENKLNAKENTLKKDLVAGKVVKNKEVAMTEKERVPMTEEEIQSREAMRAKIKERFNITSKTTNVKKHSAELMKKVESKTLINANNKEFIKELKAKTKKVKE